VQRIVGDRIQAHYPIEIPKNDPQISNKTVEGWIGRMKDEGGRMSQTRGLRPHWFLLILHPSAFRLLLTYRSVNELSGLAKATLSVREFLSKAKIDAKSATFLFSE
jgi:hypothetical protein